MYHSLWIKTLLLTGSPVLIFHARGPLFTCIYCETLVLPAVSFFLFLLTGAALTMSEVRTQHSALKNISPSVCTQLVLHPAAASYFYTQEGNKFVLSWLLSRSLRARVRFSVRRCWWCCSNYKNFANCLDSFASAAAVMQASWLLLRYQHKFPARSNVHKECSGWAESEIRVSQTHLGAAAAHLLGMKLFCRSATAIISD